MGQLWSGVRHTSLWAVLVEGFGHISASFGRIWPSSTNLVLARPNVDHLWWSVSAKSRRVQPTLRGLWLSTPGRRVRTWSPPRLSTLSARGSSSGGLYQSFQRVDRGNINPKSEWGGVAQKSGRLWPRRVRVWARISTTGAAQCAGAGIQVPRFSPNSARCSGTPRRPHERPPAPTESPPGCVGYLRAAHRHCSDASQPRTVTERGTARGFPCWEPAWGQLLGGVCWRSTGGGARERPEALGEGRPEFGAAAGAQGSDVDGSIAPAAPILVWGPRYVILSRRLSSVAMSGVCRRFQHIQLCAASRRQTTQSARARSPQRRTHRFESAEFVDVLSQGSGYFLRSACTTRVASVGFCPVADALTCWGGRAGRREHLETLHIGFRP